MLRSLVGSEMCIRDRGWSQGVKGDSDAPAMAFPLEDWLDSAHQRCKYTECREFSEELFRVMDRDMDRKIGVKDIQSQALGFDMEMNEMDVYNCLEQMGEGSVTIDFPAFVNFLRKRLGLSEGWITQQVEVGRALDQFKTFLQLCKGGKREL
eukprot:TRINITY_DN9047_c0_g1_i1.p1 TRINITY_DN9047_c0_g1~~TRINITY_DN9047_c0_g1_i1.p1  ORF type:complete len:173 (+),score=54.59 TRINITY_DN9047_c0_g1_i1:65-520(+)